MRRLTAALAATLLALTVVGCQPANRQLQEDDPGWNCHIDGNRICGPSHERIRLVSAECGFGDYDETTESGEDCDE